MASGNTSEQQFCLYMNPWCYLINMLANFALQRRQRNDANCATVYHKQLKPIACINYRIFPPSPLDSANFFFNCFLIQLIDTDLNIVLVAELHGSQPDFFSWFLTSVIKRVKTQFTGDKLVSYNCYD